MQRTHENGERRYITPEGNSYRSVTTALGKLSHDDIALWKSAIGVDEANKITSRACNRGTKLHETIEHYLLNEGFSHKNYLERTLFQGVCVQLQRINNIRLLEGPLYSDVLQLAGTVDAVAEFDGELAVIDFKSSGRLKAKHEIESYFIQTAAYSYMVEERYGLKIPKLVILIAVEFSRPQVFVEDRKNWKKQLKELSELK